MRRQFNIPPMLKRFRQILSSFLVAGMILLTTGGLGLATAKVDAHAGHGTAETTHMAADHASDAIDAHCAGHGWDCLVTANHCNSTALQEAQFPAEAAFSGTAAYHVTLSAMRGTFLTADNPPPRS
ncbi:MAG: hypothetical protein VX464_01120 [Pseudomonadota bacterium]|nr:hypothetical protein [Pseudomonadota bacterium]